MVILEVLSPLPLTKREDGQGVLDLWKTHLPDLLPDFFGNWEPIDRPFDPQKIDAVLEHWKWPFLTIKKKPSVEAEVWMRKGAKQQLHATLFFKIETAAVAQARLLAFLKAASVRLKADFACIHLLTPAELERGRKNKTVRPLDKTGKKLTFFLASKDIQQRMPELYWASVFGDPYLKMFERDRLLSTPGFAVESLSNGAVLLQLTDKLADVAERPGVFDDARAQAKVHLGIEAFFQPDLADSHVYRVPFFEFA